MPRQEFQFPLWTIFAATACVAIVFAAVRLLSDESRLVVALAIVIGVADCLLAVVFTLAAFVITSRAYEFADRIADFLSQKEKNHIDVPPDSLPRPKGPATRFWTPPADGLL